MSNTATALRAVDAPLWVRSGVSVWDEDDALTPDRERLAGAWRRLFGEELVYAHAVAKYDGGDCLAWLMPNGYAAWCSCGLSSIERCRVVSVCDNSH